MSVDGFDASFFDALKTFDTFDINFQRAILGLVAVAAQREHEPKGWDQSDEASRWNQRGRAKRRDRYVRYTPTGRPKVDVAKAGKAPRAAKLGASWGLLKTAKFEPLPGPTTRPSVYARPLTHAQFT